MQTQVTESFSQRGTSPRRQNGSALALHGESQGAPEQRMRSAGKRAQALGWFSIGLGLSQVLAPDAVSRLIGVKGSASTRSTLLAIGLREISAGVGLLAQDRPKGWLWARVAGDLVDLALLGNAFSHPRNGRDNLSLATGAVAGVLALDYLTARALEAGDPRASQVKTEKKRVKSTESLTVNRSLDEVTRQWRTYEDAHRTGIDVQFAVAPGGKGTELRAQHARFQGSAVQQDLRHFKQIVETGEVVHSDASIHRGPHPAQPSKLSGKKAKS